MAESSGHVIVIGAGISGLSAAKLLKEAGLRVTVLEARDRVGGKTYTVKDKKYGGYTDLGGTYIGPGQRRVARMAKELGLEFYKVDESRRAVYDIQGSRLVSGSLTPFINPLVILDLNNLHSLVNKWCEEVPCDEPWNARRAEEWDSITFKEFLDKHCWTSFAYETFALLCKTLWCAETHEVSFLNFLWYIKSSENLQRATAITNGAQERKFVGGAMGLSEKLAEKIGSENIKLSEPVVSVKQTNSSVTVTTSTGGTYHGDYAISAVPMTLLKRICFEPPLHPLKIQLIQRMPAGDIIKTMTFYERAFWKEKGYSGVMVTDRGPVVGTFDDTKPDGTAPCIVGFVAAKQAKKLVDQSVDERKQCIVKQYAKIFRCDEFLEPIEYVEKNWSEDEYSGGCYVGAYPTGVITEFSHVLRDPHDRVHFASSETATKWIAYMEGAIQSGERAAREIMHEMGMIPTEEINIEEPPSDYFPEPPIETYFIQRMLPSVGQFLGGCVAVGVAVTSILLAQFS